MAKPIDELVVELSLDAKKLEKGFRAAQTTLNGAGKTLTKAITAPLIGAGAALLKFGNDFDGVNKILVAGTGATGKALQSLKKDFDATLERVPDNMDTIAGALANLNTQTGATGRTLQALTESVLDVSRLLGEDAVANSAAFGTALKQWQIPAEQGTTLLDGLFKLTQDYGGSLGGLIGSLNTYGAVMQNAGFSVDETATFMAKMNSAGLDWSRVAPGLNKSFRDMAKSGVAGRDGLAEAIKAIKEATSETDQLSIATEVFGAEGAQRMLTAIKNNVIGLGDFGKTLKESEGLIEDTEQSTRTLGDEFNQLKNELIKALRPFAGDLIDAVRELIPLVKNLVDKIKDAVQWVKDLSPETKDLALKLGLAAAAVGPFVIALGSLVGAIGSVVAGGVGLAKFLVMSGPWGLALAAASAVVGLVVNQMGGWDQAITKTTGFIKQLVKEVVGAYESIKTSISLIYETAKTYLVDKFASITTGVKQHIDDTIGYFRDMWDAVVGHSYVPDTVTETGKWMGEKLKKALPDNVKTNTDEATDFFEMFRRDINDINQGIRDDANVVYDKLTSGLGDSFATAIIDGENFAESMGEVFDDMARYFIAALAKMAVEYAAFRSLVATGVLPDTTAATAQIGATAGLGPLAVAAGGAGLLGYGIAQAAGLGQKSSTLSGIGAAAGFAVGGPIGALLGGAGGAAIGELFGFDKKEDPKKAARKAVASRFSHLQDTRDKLKRSDASPEAFKTYNENVFALLNEARRVGASVKGMRDLLFTGDDFGIMGGGRADQLREAVGQSYHSAVATVKEAYTRYLTGEITKSELEKFRGLRDIVASSLIRQDFASTGVGSFADIPQFAKGGIVTAPTIGLIGEAGTEAVIPLDKLDAMTGKGAQTIIIQLDGRTIAKSVVKDMPSVLKLRGV